MKKLDWHNLQLGDGVLREPTPDHSQLVLWLRGELVDGFQQWERIANVVGAGITREKGLYRVPATVIRARQKVQGFFGNIVQLFRRRSANRTWLLPNGAVAEQVGERLNDRMLLWADDETGALDDQATPAAMHAFEIELEQLLREIGRVILQAVFNRLEPADPQQAAPSLNFDDNVYRRRERSPRRQGVGTRFGIITLERIRYEPCDADLGLSSLFPLADSFGPRQRQGHARLGRSPRSMDGTTHARDGASPSPRRP